ncbi:glycosyltransferase, partial [Aeromonas veronii]
GYHQSAVGHLSPFIHECRTYYLNSRFNGLEINFIGNPVKIYGVNSIDYIKDKCHKFIDKVNIISNFNTKQAFEYMLERNSVMVFPTLGENSPCVISEALINEVPFIAADIPGIKELVDKSYHSHNLFETNNKKSLIDGIVRVVEQPRVARFSVKPDQTIERWTKILTHKNAKMLESDICKNEPLVSVVIPTFNRYEELNVALSSIRDNTYKNIEIVVVDDGSDDPSEVEKICIKHGAKLIQGQKMFKGAASNLGVSHATGGYILFFDDDDILHSDAIEKYVNFLEHDLTCDLTSCFCDVFENKEFIETGKINSEYTSMSLGDYKSGNLISNYFGKGSFMIRREKFLEIKGFDEDFDNTHMVDYRFYIKASTADLKLHIIPSSLYSYRKNSNGSLFYESQGDPIKLYNAKYRILNSINKKIDPSLHDLISMLYMNNSNPKFQIKEVEKETSKWLGRSVDNLKILFRLSTKKTSEMKISSSDLKVIFEISIDLEKQQLSIKEEEKHEIIGFIANDWLDKNATSLNLQIRDSNLAINSPELNLNYVVPMLNFRQKNIRKIVANHDFLVS